MFLLSIALILFPFAFLDKAFSSQAKKIIITFFCLCFIFLGGIKWNTGTDWNSYYYGFLNAISYDHAVNSPYSFEWGYAILNLLINNLTGSFTVLLFLFTFLTVFFKYIVLINSKFISYSLFGLFCYYCYAIGDIVAWRQAFAISIVLFSIIFIIKRKIFPFLLCIFIATLFHRTAIVCLILYYIYSINLSKKSMLIIFFTSILTGLILFNLKVSSLNLPLLGNLDALSAYQDKLDAYNQIGQVSYGKVDSNLSNILGYLRKALFVVPMIILVKRDNFLIYRLMNFTIIGSAIYFILGAIATDFKRFGGYFDIFDILLIPAILYGIKNTKIRYLMILIYAIFMLLRLYTSLFNFWDVYDPFITIFDSKNHRQLY
ncbi:EpsG family protein [Acinetobacter schindleri]|uniref:EpsG family protein n=1 Tax=Acinetobacter schindleri TaxID=108981 RepID=UPI000972CDDB|nr:EpsG family protein [Acinetobacter schindleri]APX64132.1 EpsG family protein [Acinetobacter schindleri]